MHRRQLLTLAAASCAGAALPRYISAAAAKQVKQTGLGLVVYCCRFRRQQLLESRPQRDLYEPRAFLEHCHALGAGGMQVELGVREAGYAAALRGQAEQWGMYLEAIVRPPSDPQDVGRFDAEMRTAAQAGARAARTVIIPGRRYEYFDSLDQFRELEVRGRQALELAAPVAEKLRLPLAVENHKDQRDQERLRLFEHIGSQYVGACLDTGNSLALLEDPLETVAALAPWAHAVHLKDQALQEYPDGFLLGDIPLGQGSLDLKKMVEIIRRHKPDMRFTLELITRDPLKVPVLTDRYWATFPDLPARDLARTMRLVRTRSAHQLPQVSELSAAEQAALEDANVRASLDYARDHLGL